MANTPSAKKRIRQNEKRRLRNRAVRSAVRGNVKSAREALAGKAADSATVVHEAIRAAWEYVRMVVAYGSARDRAPQAGRGRRAIPRRGDHAGVSAVLGGSLHPRRRAELLRRSVADGPDLMLVAVKPLVWAISRPIPKSASKIRR